jgi:MurNAc alpha-1-phosphate uridylyltransferase
MTPKAIMIFAAGRGTRMGALTKDRPKPLIEVGGRALIDHALDLTRDPSVAPLNCVANLHYHGDLLRQHLEGSGVVLSDESDMLRETGGGLKKALPLLGEGPVFTLNSDAVWDGPNPLKTLVNGWDEDRMDGLLLLIPRENALGHKGLGDFFIDEEGRLGRGAGLVYSGAQIIRTDGLSAIQDPVFSLNRLWDDMLRKGTLFGAVQSGRWCDVGQPESLPLAEALLRGSDVH